MTTIKLNELTLIGNKKSYTIKFHDGFNYISGNTSTGKTSIFEMIDYALGAKSHKSYIEIGKSCTHVELVLYIGTQLFRIRRPLFDFKAPVIVEDWSEKNEKFLFYNNYEIDTPKNPRSLAAFLIERIGLANITIKKQTLSFRDIFKYCYLKQTEIDNENILHEKNWEYNFKRKATFEILFNIFDEGYEEAKKGYDELLKEIHDLEIKLSGINDFIKTLDIKNHNECYEYIKRLNSEITHAQLQLNKLKSSGEIEDGTTIQLRNNIENEKNKIQNLTQAKIEQEQYIHKLILLKQQYIGEINKKQLALQGYLAFNEYEFLFCPNCLQPIQNSKDIKTCCLCGKEKTNSAGEALVIKKEISLLNRKSTELSKLIESEQERLESINGILKSTQQNLHDYEYELLHLSKQYINPQIEQIEQLNFEIGKKYRLISESEENLKAFNEVDRYKKITKDKRESLLILKNNLKAIKETQVDKNELFCKLSQLFSDILSKFKYPKLSNAYIDMKTYLPYVRDRKYDDIGSLAGVSLITMAYYLSIMLMSFKNNYYHPNLLMIDSPRKNLGAQESDEDFEFKDEEIFNAVIETFYSITKEYNENIQLIVINNGYPDSLPKKCIIAEFDSEGRNGLKKGLIDDID